MARMKFLCDTKRCIECNGCVTACKNENDDALEWGIQRRRVVTLNDGERVKTRFPWLACTVPMRLVWRCVQQTALSIPKMALCCTTKIFVSVVVTACLLVRLVRRSFRNRRRLVSAVRWTNVPSVLAALKQSRVRKRNVVNTEPTVLRKANCHVRFSLFYQSTASGDAEKISDIFRQRVVERGAKGAGWTNGEDLAYDATRS